MAYRKCCKCESVWDHHPHSILVKALCPECNSEMNYRIDVPGIMSGLDAATARLASLQAEAERLRGYADAFFAALAQGADETDFCLVCQCHVSSGHGASCKATSYARKGAALATPEATQ